MSEEIDKKRIAYEEAIRKDERVILRNIIEAWKETAEIVADDELIKELTKSLKEFNKLITKQR